MKTTNNLLYKIDKQRDIKWALFWLVGIQFLLLWNELFLNKPAFDLLKKAFLNSFIIGTLVLINTFVLAWGIINLKLLLKNIGKGILITILDFIIDIIKSTPQIISVLLGYIFITLAITNEKIKNEWVIIYLIALLISIVIFPEMYETMNNRIKYFKKSDFYNSMLVCGINEYRIINYDILFKNSVGFIIHKIVSLFGVALFLQCSMDFIISVGLSNDVSLNNFPATLGNLLAKMDSKQDILALGKSITDPFYIAKLPFEHLQGLSTAFIIVFTLLCVFKISDGIIKRINR
jgi:ABC-type dipeptide/oligopeptide/nickel transport system permease subunit